MSATAPATDVIASSSAKTRPSTVALWVLAVAVVTTMPGLLAAAVWILHQPWITAPALLVVAAMRWRPKSLLMAALLGRQYIQQRQTKTA